MMKKKIAFALLLGVLAFGSCRKTEPVTLPKNGAIGEAHCSNGVMDADEDGVDCGPSCGPCVLSLPAFGTVPQANTFKIVGTTVTFPDANVLSDTTSGVLIITATTGTGGTLTAKFGTSTPEVFSEYVITPNTPNAGQVKLTYSDGTNYSAYSSNDQVHLNRINGKYSMVFTEVYMSYNGGIGSLYTVTSGHINPAN